MYEPKKYEQLLGIPGFSDQLLNDHFTLYQGYVKNVNAALEAMNTLTQEGKTATPMFAEVRRRFGWEFNGMRLHEYYFENMSKNPSGLSSETDLARFILSTFQSHETWLKDFQASGVMRGIGWVILYYDPRGKKLLNVWVNEHDMGHLSGCVPLLVLDVFEHAYIRDYGLKRPDYISAFVKAIDWSVVEKRFATATIATS